MTQALTPPRPLPKNRCRWIPKIDLLPLDILIVGQGNRAFMDLVQIGIPLALIVPVLSVLLAPWPLPLH
jgi:hypothetical protein